MLAEFKALLRNNFSYLADKPLLLACSGGVDSVVLTHLCVASGLKVTLAHCNFQLRGDESDDDEAFVKQLAKNLSIPILTKSFDVKKYIQTNGGSTQMAARELRYQWFVEVLDEYGFEYVLTAHHADDSLETFLINLSRGTGIDGLTGIPSQNEKVVRPLIHFSREVILKHAESEQLNWREDSSNLDNKYLRNKIRNELVPKLKGLHPTFLENFTSTQHHLNQTKDIAQNHLNDIKERLFQTDNNRIKIEIERLQELQPLEAYLYGLFQAYGFTEWNDVKGLLTTMSGKEVYSKTHRLLKDREHLILSKIESPSPRVFLVEEEETDVSSPIQLQLEQVESMERAPKNVVFIDKEKLNYPLILRNWEKGDYFYPLGMKGKKKLSKFFKDEKMDVFAKEKQWLLCSGPEIVWVVGKRSDERFKVDTSTKNILKITCVE